MKKLVMLVGAIVLTGTSFAQRPVDSNPFSLEGGLSLNVTENTFSSPAIRFRYFATESIAARLGITYNVIYETINHYKTGLDGGDIKDSMGTDINKNSMSWFSIGGSFHFSQLEKLSPYVALDVMFGMGSTDFERTDYDGTKYEKGEGRTSTTKNSGLGLVLGAGFDYYFAENVFFGAELGMTFMSTMDKGGDGSRTSAGIKTVYTTEATGETSSFANSANAMLRLGWRF
jgi:outer membrane protein W